MRLSFQNIVFSNNFYTRQKPFAVSFRQSLSCPCDSFEKSVKPEKAEKAKKAEPAETITYQIKTKEYKGADETILTVTQNPLDKAQIYKKVLNEKTGKTEKVPFVVDVAYITDKTETTFYFVDPETKKEVGYVIVNNLKELISKDERAKSIYSEYLENFPKEGIVGERVIIEYLQNSDESKYGGIGIAADQVVVEFCLKNDIKPNIVSTAIENSHVAHYKRGRRFFTIDKNDFYNNGDYFVERYKTNDPNKIIGRKIAMAEEGEQINTEDLGSLMMYMPKEIVQKYIKLSQENPILH